MRTELLLMSCVLVSREEMLIRYNKSHPEEKCWQTSMSNLYICSCIITYIHAGFARYCSIKSCQNRGA